MSAQLLITWDRWVMAFTREDETCSAELGPVECQRRWGHHGLHAYFVSGVWRV